MRKLARGLLIGVTLIAGCGYGEVSPTTYEYAKSLYNITNRKLGDRLDGIRPQIARCRESGEVSVEEAKWLYAIIDEAENGHWQEAMQAARRIMDDQVQD